MCDIQNQKDNLMEEIVKMSCENNEDRVSLCKFYLNKHRFENYSLKSNYSEIADSDYILSNKDARLLCNLCINDERCSIDDIKFIIGKMSYEELTYMGI